MQRQTIFISLLFMGFASADLLQNPYFESPPANLTGNSTSSFVLLSPNNTIPGWTFEGTVQYVTAGENISLPGDGHGVQLCQDGKINQTFIADGNISDYLLTFILAAGGRDCLENADVVISAPDSSKAFSFKQNYSTEPWEAFGHYLGSWGQGELVNLVFQSQTAESNPNSTCWPVINSVLLESVPTVRIPDENLFPNGRFEIGPEFPSNSTEGILLEESPSSAQSPIRPWTISGTVKLISAERFFLPQGGAAVEIVSGVSAGIRTVLTLSEGWDYTLQYTLGDANDSCVGDFEVGAQIGQMTYNFSLASIGTGLALPYYIGFSADPNATPISFTSYKTTRTRDGVLCGPVVADVVLRAFPSHGIKLETPLKVLVSVYVLAAVLLNLGDDIKNLVILQA